MNKTIKNIIFDFGGVIYDIRYENVMEAIAKRGVNLEGDFYGRHFQTHEMDLFEMGLMSVKDYRDYVRSVAQCRLSDTDIDEIVNALLIDLPSERVDLLLQLRRRYRLFLFSNTNAINYECFSQQMLQKFGFDVFETCFDHAYFSHLIHCRKPSKDGFELILNQQSLVPAETLFIDDIEVNLEGAKSVGMQTFWLSEGTICDNVALRTLLSY